MPPPPAPPPARLDPTEPPPTPGRLVRRAREEAYLSQEALARLAGMSPGALSRVELDRRPPRWDVLQRLLACLDLQPRLTVEPLDAHVDALLDAAAAAPPLDWVLDDVFDLGPVLRLVARLDLLVDGCLAARLHGVPVPLGNFELVVPTTCDDDTLELTASAAHVELRRDDDGDDGEPRWWCRRERRFVLARRPAVTPPWVHVLPPATGEGGEELPGPLRVVAVDHLGLDGPDARLLARALRRRHVAG